MAIKEITRRPYRYLVDFEKVYRFMVKNYSIDCAMGEKAPFFEYAQTLIDFDREHTYLYSIWEDDGEIVAFCYYEMNPAQVSCSFKNGYEYLVDDVISYAEQYMGNEEGKISFSIYSKQEFLVNGLIRKRYKKISEKPVKIYDLMKPLEYSLSKGFSFLQQDGVDYKKLTQMIWKSFGSDDWESKDATGAYIQQASPHKNKDLDVIIVASNGDYACFAGMWFVAENKLAYLEPLCTMPEYRRMGLASAALSELSKRTKKLGATHMTGGDNDFYTKLGYDTVSYNEIWEKE
jgi:predicted N-acetyltransferase YhbS